MELYDYQKEGVSFLQDNDNCILADEMGLGKTPQVIMSLRKKDLPAVVICPASVRAVWSAEIKKWRPRLSVCTINTSKAKVTPADITIISYSLFGKVKLRRPRRVICDEAHYLQGRRSARTLAVTEAVKDVPIWLLTGTPIWSTPRSLYPLLKIIKCYRADYRTYAVHFCDAGYKMIPIRGRGLSRVWDDSGSSNLHILARKTAPFIKRRKKAEVLKQLPAKTRQVISYPARLGDGEEAAVKEFKATGKCNFGDGPIATAQKDSAFYRMKYMIDFIELQLKSQRQLIVFAWNTQIIDQTARALMRYGVSTIEGATAPEARAAAVEDFQSGKNRIFLGQIAAAGTGITLTAASNVIFMQATWTPAELMQAEDRAHRIGQKDNVLIQYLVTDGGIEQAMLNTVIRKISISEKIIDDNQK